MTSPIRTENRGSGTLGALSPIVQVIKNTQSNASRDFERFYDNLWSKITPRNNNVKRNMSFFFVKYITHDLL